MHPSERIKLIKNIAEVLGTEDWKAIDLTLKQFHLPWTDQWQGDIRSDYIIDMISEVDDEALLELAKHLGIASKLESTAEPSFWSQNESRIFLSHLAKNKEETSKLADALSEYAIVAFVAHEDIEPAKEWQSEIELALSTMDALVALLTPGFKESNWCDQEIGVAIGRRVPILSVRMGLDPYGFIGKYQGFQGNGKSSEDIAWEIFKALIIKPGIGTKITQGIVDNLVNSESWSEAKSNMSILEECQHLTPQMAAELREAVEENSQVGDAWGVPDRIEALIKKIGS